VGVIGLEPMTPSVSSWRTPDANRDNKVLLESNRSVCTPVCTSEPKVKNATPLDALAAILLGLSPEDRARLAAILIGATMPVAGNGQ